MMDEIYGCDKGPRFGVRHVQVLLLFFSRIVASIIRLNISVTVVAMTNASTTNPDFTEYKWNEKQISMILSSFYLGATISTGPGSQICRKLGAKVSLLISFLGSSFFCLIVPVSIPLGGWQIFCILRIILGLFQGILTPAVYDQLAKWCPTEERSRLGAFVQLGTEIGTIIAILLPGFIARSNLGWPGISYVSAGLSLLWSFFWLIFSDNTPNLSRYINTKEKQFILDSQCNYNTSKEKISVPWKAIITSKHFLSLLLVILADKWGSNTLLSQLPLYMRGVLKMDIKKNSFFSALPYMVRVFTANIYIIGTEIILTNKLLSLGTLRKTVSTLALWIPSVALIAVGFFDEDKITFIIGLMIFAIGMNAGNTIGFTLNVIDLSPNHSASLIGITHTLGNIVGMATPLFAGMILSDETNRIQWQLVFLVAALMYFFGNLQYIFFATTAAQPWNAKDFFKNGVSEQNKQFLNETKINIQLGNKEFLKEENGELIKEEIK